MEYQLVFNEKDLIILNQLLMDAPFKIAAPLINKINEQISTQTTK